MRTRKHQNLISDEANSASTLEGFLLIDSARLKIISASGLIALISAIAIATIVLCHGRLIYTLDDPYISLSLGWHIGHGQ